MRAVRWAWTVRVLFLLLAVAGFGYAVANYEARVDPFGDGPLWPFLGAALLLSILWQWRLGAQRPAVTPSGATPAMGVRVQIGAALAAIGFALFCWAAWALYRDWQASFDAAWLAWIAAAAMMGIGLDLAWGRWPRPSGLWSAADAWIALAIFALAAGLRGWGLVEMPGPYHVTQLEEAQIGNFGYAYLVGGRNRWEFLSHMWLSALGQKLFGSADLLPVRIPFALVSALKVVPLYFFLRWMVGRAGACVGAALLACSGWDVMLSRIPTNQNELTVATTLAVLAGPARRGRPSAYVFLGLVGGFVAYEYIAYRPLFVFALVAAVVLSFADRSSTWQRRAFRPALVLVLAVVMATPLFAGKLQGHFSSRYLDGWNRARGDMTDRETADWQAELDSRLRRTRAAFGTLFFLGDRASVRNVNGRALLDPVTGALLIAGVAFALTHWLAGLAPLILVGFVVTFTGTLIATGTLYLGRAGCTTVYIHALAGFGAAGLAALLGEMSAAVSRRAATAAALAACVAAAAWSNTRFLLEYWRSPTVRNAQHYELAYQTHWLSRQVQPGERVAGLSALVADVLSGNDAAWMRAAHVQGAVYVDAWSLVEEIRGHSGEPMFVYVAAGGEGAEVVGLLETIWPALRFEIADHPVHGRGAAYYFARVDRGALHHSQSRFDDVECRSARGRYILRSRDGSVRRRPAVFPFFARSTWPQRIRIEVRQAPPLELNLEAEVPVAIEKAGRYVFQTVSNQGRAQIALAGGGLPGLRQLAVDLQSGTHVLELRGSFAARGAGPSVRLEWSGPDTGNQPQLLPIYRVGPRTADCGDAAAES